jgi:hypothetical protein
MESAMLPRGVHATRSFVAAAILVLTAKKQQVTLEV